MTQLKFGVGSQRFLSLELIRGGRPTPRIERGSTREPSTQQRARRQILNRLPNPVIQSHDCGSAAATAVVVSANVQRVQCVAGCIWKSRWDLGGDSWQKRRRSKVLGRNPEQSQNGIQLAKEVGFLCNFGFSACQNHALAPDWLSRSQLPKSTATEPHPKDVGRAFGECPAEI
jgi:hypothetical protein